MTGKNIRFLGLCAKDKLFPKLMSYHCIIIHEEALCAEAQSCHINYILPYSTCLPLFKCLLNTSDAEHVNVILTELRRLVWEKH